MITVIGTEYSLETGKPTGNTETVSTVCSVRDAAIRYAGFSNGTVGPSGRTVFYGDNLCLVFVQA